MVLVNVEDLKKELDALMERRGVTSWMQTAFDAQDILWIIEETPAADAMEIVRCKDCKHYDTYRYDGTTSGDDDYCVDGMREESNES